MADSQRGRASQQAATAEELEGVTADLLPRFDSLGGASGDGGARSLAAAPQWRKWELGLGFFVRGKRRGCEWGAEVVGRPPHRAVGGGARQHGVRGGEHRRHGDSGVTVATGKTLGLRKPPWPLLNNCKKVPSRVWQFKRGTRAIL